jgi:xylulokinase
VTLLTKEYVIGLDLGTTGLKLVMIDDGGVVQGTAFEPYSLIQPKMAWVEQAPNEWTKATVDGLHSIIAKCKVPVDHVVGIGIASQIDGVVAIDDQGKPLGNAIIWMDRRAKAECEQIRQVIADEPFYSLTGLSIDPSHMAPKIMWIRENLKNEYRAADRFLLPGNYLLFFLTGQGFTDHSNASCSMLYDLKHGEWSKHLCEILEIPVELLPEIHDSTSIAGTLNSNVAEMSGLSRAVKVAVGGGDEEVGAVGAGVLDHRALLDLTGTSEPMCLSLDEPLLDPTRLLECHAHGRNGRWLLENTGGLSGGIYRWFRDEFAFLEASEGAKEGVDAYEILNREISSVRAGSDGLLFLPYLSGAILPEWNPDARGAFLGITLGHKRRHFARSIMEGTAYVLKDYVEHISGIGLAPTRTILAGGGARGKVWRQIKTDVIGMRTLSCRNQEVTVLGASILAAVGVGFYRSVEDAVSKIVSMADEVVPVPQSMEVYSKLYRLYREAYDDLKLTSEKIASYQEA